MTPQRLFQLPTVVVPDLNFPVITTHSYRVLIDHFQSSHPPSGPGYHPLLALDLS